jgi:type I restriction enzyme S subunit
MAYSVEREKPESRVSLHEHTFRHFVEVKVTLPDVAEQRKVAIVVDEADRELHLLMAHLEQHQTKKRGLMKKLLTGQWRVTVEKS